MDVNADYSSHFGDGMNVHQYASSNPAARRDPLGLFGFIDLGFGSSTISELYQDHADRVFDVGSTIQAKLSGMFENYALDQFMDLLWAMDWTGPDDAYSMSGLADPVDDDYFAEDEDGPGSHGPMMAGVATRWHHIATNKYLKRPEQWTARFRRIFDKAGMSLNDKANLLEMSAEIHRKPHAQKYHQAVFARLERATRGLSGPAAKDALVKELDAIRAWLTSNPNAINGAF